MHVDGIKNYCFVGKSDESFQFYMCLVDKKEMSPNPRNESKIYKKAKIIQYYNINDIIFCSCESFSVYDTIYLDLFCPLIFFLTIHLVIKEKTLTVT